MFGKVVSIAADFKFEIASALLNTSMLSDAVSDLSLNAKLAQNTLFQLGQALTERYLVPTSILGIGGAALQAADNFRHAQTEWANLISMNRHNLSGTIDSFNDRLMVSRKIMAEISGQAVKFGLKESELNYTATKMAADLSNKGLAGTNFDFPIEMARNLLKASPALSVDPSLVYASMQRAFMGGASKNDPLFSRLSMDTKTMKEFSGIGGTKLFNALPMAKRIQTINKAMGEFTKDTDVLDRRLNSITGQLNVLRSAFIGFEGILTKIGSQLYPIVIDILKQANIAVGTYGKQIGNNLSNALSNLGSSSEQLATNLFTATYAAEALNKSKLIVSVIGIALGIKTVIDIFRGGGIGATMAKMTKLQILGKLIGVFIKPLLLVGALFAVISRAMALGKMKSIQMAPKVLADFTAAGARLVSTFKRLFSPLVFLVDLLAEPLSYLFVETYQIMILTRLFEQISDLLEPLSFGFQKLFAALSAVFAGISYTLNHLIAGNFSKLGNFQITDFMLLVWKDQLDAMDKMAKNAEVTSNQTVNIGQVKIENRFKENAQPDRIAFTMRDQLLDLAESRRQANTLPFTPAFGR